MAKRTIENCSLVKKAVREGIGTSYLRDGKCMGYSAVDNDDDSDGDEPCEKCKACKMNTTYGIE